MSEIALFEVKNKLSGLLDRVALGEEFIITRHGKAVARLAPVSFVLDSSVALTWCFEDEASPAADALLGRLTDEGAHAPSLWPLEVLNALAMTERCGRIARLARQRRAAFLQALPVALDMQTAECAWLATSLLAEAYRLTRYDVAYLELAQRLELPLATLDADLRAAANAFGVPLLL
jgi:prevent-host-death family protein